VGWEIGGIDDLGAGLLELVDAAGEELIEGRVVLEEFAGDA
jgi:hypothetical protein